jgi:FkbM family methyltransferase
MRTPFMWRAIRARYRDQRSELKAIYANIKDGDIVCDIGANKGSYMYWLSRWASRGSVIAFEAQPRLATYLQTACEKLHLRNVTVEAKGVYSSTGHCKLYIPTQDSPGATLVDHAGSSGEMITIPVVSLDDYFSKGPNPSLLKIDVEGAEMDVFLGADRILRESGPAIIFECEERHLKHHSASDVFSYLHHRGYRGKFIKNGHLIDVREFRADIHQKSREGAFWNEKSYCNNFVFVKP